MRRQQTYMPQIPYIATTLTIAARTEFRNYLPSSKVDLSHHNLNLNYVRSNI